MALTPEENATFIRLLASLTKEVPALQVLDAYYEGTHRLAQMGLAVPPELEAFTTVVNWCRVAADSLEERIDLEGFRLANVDGRDEDLWRVWQANELDEESQMAHVDALVFGRSFICVGANAEDPTTPYVTVESPLEMTCEFDPRTRAVSSAIRSFKDTASAEPADYATLFFPLSTVWMVKKKSLGPDWVEDPEHPRDTHNLGVVPVVPIVNRGRTRNRMGVSELADVISLTDAAARALTLAQLATEALSVPQRYVLGATKGDFVDADGEQLTAWQSYFGTIWALQNSDAKVGQFDAADLANFERIVNHYAAMVSGVTGLPLRFFGQNTANPPSAEGIRADEARTVKRAERRQRAWGGSWEKAARLIKRFQSNGADPDPELVLMEVIWRDAATPTRAQQADAVVKLKQVGLLPDEAAWEELGYSQSRIVALKRMRSEQLAATDVLGAAVESFRTQSTPAAPSAPVPVAPSRPVPGLSAP